MENYLWLLSVAGGPLLIAIALAFALMKRRSLTPMEKDLQNRKVDELYDHPHSSH